MLAVQHEVGLLAERERTANAGVGTIAGRPRTEASARAASFCRTDSGATALTGPARPSSEIASR